MIAPLASRASSDAIGHLLACEDDLVAAFATTLAIVEADHASRTTSDEHRAVGRHLKQLRAKRVPTDALDVGPASADALAKLRAAEAAATAARAEAVRVLDGERLRVSRVLREIAVDSRFREAVQWQNRQALLHGVDALLRKPEAVANKQVRKHERLITSYLQRYCTKNETIGFFGPMAWAHIEDAASFTVRTGPSLLARRDVYFEYWGIDVLAETMAANPALRPDLAPRRMPSLRVDGTTLHYPIDRTKELPAVFARLLAACDGETSARQIARRLLEDRTLELEGEDEVYELLEDLVGQRLLQWTLEVSPHGEHFDRTLATMLSKLPDREAAAPEEARLAELQAARAAVAAAAGDAAAVGTALEQLDAVFVRLTEASPTRRAGQTYAGRTLVYEDCRRDLAMTIGPATIERFAAPLALVLQSARWFTYEIAKRYRAVFEALFHELAQGAPSVSFFRFWDQATQHFTGHGRKAAPLIEDIVAELQARWASVLGLTTDTRQVDVPVDEIAERVAEVFAAPHPGWPSARMHSPDLMVAADGVEAIARGEFVVVAGELHVGGATVAAPATVRLHPTPQQLVDALAHCRPTPIIEAVAAKERGGRSSAFSVLAHDTDLEIGASRSRRSRDQVIEAGALVVELAGSRLQIRDLARGRVWPLEVFLDSFLSNESASHFKIVAARRHTPRVSIGGMTMHRESWHFTAVDLAFAAVDDSLERALAVRRWARENRIPRFTFYKVPQETKPCYLDLDSPAYVEQFAHLVRQAPSVNLSEMLPSTEELWLPDASGDRYTCELRLVAVDPVAWQPL